MYGTETFKNTKVLITGGCGFIGSNLARTLVHAGAEVTLVDSLIPEYGGNLFNIKDIEKDVRVNFSDVRDPFSMRFLIGGQDFLFNLAGQTSHMDSMSDPQTDLAINAQAQLSILETCRKYNPTVRVVFASTRQLYGRPKSLPVNETHPIKPVDVNGINKLAGEMYHILYDEVYGIRSSALRLTNTYGPGMRVKDARQTFVGIWIRNILEGRRFEIWGGDQLRDFNYVDDVVQALLLCARSDTARGQVYNLGGAPAVSLRDLATILVKVAGKGDFDVKEFPADRKKIDIGDYYSDYSLIKQSLNWEPVVDLATGLAKTIEFYTRNMSHYV